jgi:Cu/Zn superoxide dismutase
VDAEIEQKKRHMRKTIGTGLILAWSLPLLSATMANAADNAGGKVFALNAQNGSGEHGTVALKPRGSKTVIEIHLIGAPSSAQPAHIHMGSCAKLNPAPKYPLTSVIDGISETTVDQPMAALTAGGMAINVHKSLDDLKDYVACGAI